MTLLTGRTAGLSLPSCPTGLLRAASPSICGNQRPLLPVQLRLPGCTARRQQLRASILQEAPVPMSSQEQRNLHPVEAIRKLRVITAIKTPYLPDGRFDLEAFDRLVHHQMKSGVEGIIVGGTTGEGQLMSWDEHIMLIAHAVNCFGDKLKIIGNTGSNSTRESIHATEQGFAVGMDGSLQINPYYGKTSMDGVLMHLQASLCMGPAIVYNVPSRTGQDITPEVMEKLAVSENFAGVKECKGNERVAEYARKGLAIWSGNDDQCHDARWTFGARGVISVTSNLVPKLMHDLLFQGPNPELRDKLIPLMNWLFHEPNPIPLNTALSQLGIIRPIFRLPYVPVGRAKREEFVRIVRDIGLEHFCGAETVQVLEDDDFSVVARF